MEETGEVIHNVRREINPMLFIQGVGMFGVFGGCEQVSKVGQILVAVF